MAKGGVCSHEHHLVLGRGQGPGGSNQGGGRLCSCFGKAIVTTAIGGRIGSMEEDGRMDLCREEADRPRAAFCASPGPLCLPCPAGVLSPQLEQSIILGSNMHIPAVVCFPEPQLLESQGIPGNP